MEHSMDQNCRATARHEGHDERGGANLRYVFVGEKRSRRAIELGVHWTDGRLCAKTLHEALRALGLDPRHQRFLNLYQDREGWAVNPAALAELRSLAETGIVIVGLGRRVQAALRRTGLPHRSLVHPAARGFIRGRAVYQARVAAVLGHQRATA